MTIKTKDLKKILHPNNLEDALSVLLQRGDIIYYRIGSHTTTIKPAKGTEVVLLLSEESKPRLNPRPYVQNKTLTKKK